MSTLQFIEKTANNELSAVHLSIGDHIEIIAQPGESYNLIDTETGFTVNDIGTERFGNDLLLFSEEDDIQIWIRDFWDGQCIPGESQCFVVLDVPGMDGRLGQVTITQQGQILDHLIAGEMGTLGDGEALCAYITTTTTGLWTGIHSGALIAGFAAIVGGIAIAASGSDHDAVAPNAPKVNSISNEYSGIHRPNAGAAQPLGKTIIMGQAEAGSTVGIDTNHDGKADYFVKVDDQGHFTLQTKAPLSENGSYSLVVIRDDGNVSKPTLFTVPISAPASKPISIEIGNDGDQLVTPSEMDHDGKVKVTVGLPAETKIGYLVDINGVVKEVTDQEIRDQQVSVLVDGPKNGHELDVSATITGFNNKPSLAVNSVIKAHVDAPQFEQVDVVDADSSSVGNTTIIGTAVPSGRVGIDLNGDGQLDVTTDVDASGHFTLNIDKALERDQAYSIMAFDKEGNPSEAQNVSYDGSSKFVLNDVTTHAEPSTITAMDRNANPSMDSDMETDANETGSFFDDASFNTLHLEGEDTILNFDNVHNISAIDMADDANANSLTISSADVLHIARPNSLGIQELFVSGGDNDTLYLDGDYQSVGHVTYIEGQNYQRYHSSNTNTDVWVEETLNQNLTLI